MTLERGAIAHEFHLLVQNIGIVDISDGSERLISRLQTLFVSSSQAILAVLTSSQPDAIQPEDILLLK